MPEEAPQTSHAGSEPPANPGPSIGVALSGGGIRASLFSLGVLAGLVHLGVNGRVQHIASVSGGSITNAAVAQSVRYADCQSVEQFAARVQTLARQLSRSGMFVFSRAAALAGLKFLLVNILGWLILLWFGGAAVTTFLNWLSDKAAWPHVGEVVARYPYVVAGTVVVGLVAALVLSRGAMQEAFIRVVLAGMDKADGEDGASSGHVGLRHKLRDLADSGTHHVLIATDLVSGHPVYFSRDFVACPAFGWGGPGELHTASAVYASAAFPVVFPPRRMRRSGFSFQGGTIAPPYPRRLKLIDGGVHNNLGTDWFDELDAQTASSLWPFGGQQHLQSMTPCQQTIVVNSGAASRGLHRVWPLMSVRRTMSVLYDNTVQPRLDHLRDRAQWDPEAPIVIDIAQSPVEVAQGMLDRRDRVEGVKERVDDVVNRLRTGKSSHYWADFTTQTSREATKLSRAGVECGARMMLHGYLSTLVALHCLEAVPLPDDVLGEGFFLDLAGRRDVTASAQDDEESVSSPSDLDPVDASPLDPVPQHA